MLPKAVDVKVVVRGSAPSDADAVAVVMAKGSVPTGLPDAVAAAVAALVKAGLATGKAGESVVQLLDGHKPSRLVVVGLGDPAKLDAARHAGGTLARAAKQHKLRTVAVLCGDADAASVASGFVLGRFSYGEHKGAASDPGDRPGPVKLTIVGDGDAGDAVESAVVVAEAQNFARTIAMRPGNDVNPPSLAHLAKQLAEEVGLKATVLDEKEMAKLGMGGILGVGAGSATPPRMIVLEHGGARKGHGKRKGAVAPPLLVVGKSITFDTGGISIKPAANMQSMVFDKCGGMAVLGLMYALAKLKVATRVVGILAAAENHISGTAYRPGDILRMYNGVTVEVTNTDAEGRLVLGDALAWGIDTYKPTYVVDLATLTGACVVALGTTIAGLMSNSDDLVAQLQRAATAAGEKVWRLPVDEEHRERLKSVPADIVNAPGREGGALTAAAFLSHFIGTDGAVQWAHLDIAGVADTDKATPIYAKGATGWGVRTLVEWVTNRANAAANPEAAQMTPPPAGG